MTESIEHLRGEMYRLLAREAETRQSEIVGAEHRVGGLVFEQLETMSQTINRIEHNVEEVMADVRTVKATQESAIRRMASDRVTLNEHDVELEHVQKQQKREQTVGRIQGGAASTLAIALIYVLAKVIFGIDLP